MKKLFITTVLALGSLTAFAQETETMETQEPATEVQEEANDVSAQGTEAVAEGQEAMSQDDFSEIAIEEVPEAVSTMIETNYPGASMDAASKSEAGHYKVEVSLEDGTSGALIVDEEGNAVEQ